MTSFTPSMKEPCSMTNIKDCMPLIFEHESLPYEAWSELFQSYCLAYGVIDHIQDSVPKPDDPEWNRIDSMVKLWIYGTISQSQRRQMLLKKNDTARQAWKNLETVFNDSEATSLNNELRNIVLGDSSITDYCTRIKTITDRLEKIGHAVPENKLVIYTINGLPQKFQFGYITDVIRLRSPLPSFSETRSMLLLEESRKSKINLSLIRYLSVGMEEPGAITEMIYNSDHLFDDYIGQLYLARKMKVEENASLWEFCKEREAKLITFLKNRLEPFVKGQTEKFVNRATFEARQLSQARNGLAMLHIIGYIYISQAEIELGKDKLFMVPFLVERVRNIGYQMKIKWSSISGSAALRNLQEELKKLNKEEEIKKAVEEKKIEMLDCLWYNYVAYIETALSLVCEAVLTDSTVSKDELKQRAIGMKKLGTIFQETRINYWKEKSLREKDDHFFIQAA